MDTERPEIQTSDYPPTKADLENIRSRIKVLKGRKAGLISQYPNYRRGGCIYDHFFINWMQDIGGFLIRLAERDKTLNVARRYQDALLSIGQLEHYQSLLESRPDLAGRELTKIYRIKGDLDRHIEELQGKNYAE